jgi:hypothetical protein
MWEGSMNHLYWLVKKQNKYTEQIFQASNKYNSGFLIIIAVL